MNLFKRIYHLLRRRYRAKQYRINYRRSRNWTLAEKVFVNGEYKQLKLPNELGVKNYFLDIFLDDCYGLLGIKDLSRVQTILDIGAHAGIFSLYARSLCPQSIIHAYEPNKEMERFLKHQAKSGNFQYFLEAVGSGSGRASLRFGAETVFTVCYPDPDGRVSMVSFQDCLKRLGGKADILKIDCEGGEWEIFNDMDSWKKVRHLGMEYHLADNHTFKEALERIDSLGFRMIRHVKSAPDFGFLMAVNKNFRVRQ